jgi:hypothetical protein
MDDLMSEVFGDLTADKAEEIRVSIQDKQDQAVSIVSPLLKKAVGDSYNRCTEVMINPAQTTVVLCGELLSAASAMLELMTDDTEDKAAAQSVIDLLSQKVFGASSSRIIVRGVVKYDKPKAS